VNKEVRKWMLKNNWPEAVAASSVGKASKSSKKLEKELETKVGKGPASGTSSAVSTTATEAAKPTKRKAGPATLDIIEDKLDIVIELLEARAPKTAVPKATTKSDLQRDSDNIKQQLGNVQG
jgi:hypothetical protein